MKSYGQACPVAHALDAVGDRWSLLVLRELRLGPRRYTDLAAALPGVGPSVLSQRLRDLEAGGVLERRTLPPPAAAVVYALTGWGAELEPVFRALARWGMGSPQPLRGSVSADSVMLGLRTFFRRGAQPWTAVVEVRVGREVYVLRVVDGELTELVRGAHADSPDVTLGGPLTEVAAVLAGTVAVGSAAVTLDGDAAVLDLLLASVVRSP
jgi:DNA-binding HxlR family transcriptional regulator